MVINGKSLKVSKIRVALGVSSDGAVGGAVGGNIGDRTFAR